MATLPFEIFAAKDAGGVTAGIFLSVPYRCGLREADTLRLEGRYLVALQFKSIMPLDFDPLSEGDCERLATWVQTGKPLPVAEFMARGLYDAYFLNLVMKVTEGDT